MRSLINRLLPKTSVGLYDAPSDRQQRAKQHVVVLTQFYSPEPIMFTPDMAAAIAEAGHEVSVVTGYPNRPGGKLYPEYRQRFGFSELIDGIRVHRVPLMTNHSRKPLERILNFLTFSISALSATSKIKTADVVYVYATPATAAIPAQIWHRLLGIPYVLHVQDLWPESVTESGMLGTSTINKAARVVLDVWLKRLYGSAAGLIAISPGMKRLLVDRGYREERCSVVYNWAEEAAITVKDRDSFSATGLKLLYAGNLGPMQDLITVIEAARSFDDASGFELNMAGEGILEDDLHAAAEGSPHIHFLGNLSVHEVGQRYLEADFQLVTLKDIPIFRTTVPSKLQSSLATGVPVITTVAGDVADLIVQYEAGLVAQPEDADSLAQAFATAQNMSADERARMGANARKLYQEKMSRESATTEIVALLDNVTATATNSHPAYVEETS